VPQVEPDSIELTVRGFSADSAEGLAAVRSGCTVNLIPATRSGLDTTLHARSRAVNQEDICGLLEALESAGDSINAKVTIVFSGDDGAIGETHLDASLVAVCSRGKLLLISLPTQAPPQAPRERNTTNASRCQRLHRVVSTVVAEDRI
jgi:hypothetical protein